MVSGSFSLLCSRFFSPFLHSTGSLSVSREYLALRDGPRGFIQDFSCPALLRSLLRLWPVSPTGLSPSLTGLSSPFGYLSFRFIVVLQPRICRNRSGLGSSAFARHYSRNHSYFLFLWVMRCFSSPRSPPALRDDTGYGNGLPHSEICGSRDICSSPQLFAAYHVLLRLREPRHPPYALLYFLRLCIRKTP